MANKENTFYTHNDSYHIESLNHTLIFQTGNDMTGDDAKSSSQCRRVGL